ncbi:MAG: DNA polymerase III subunit gamma/tau [Clostridium sp.]|nr:DNA polymerase III subunit gamma/tau [Clostridium sp.]
MAYTALYREWRPKYFKDVVGQEHITTTLKNQIQNNRIAHAYLFCGTRGTGKTSTAKIMAKALNCLNNKYGEPCNECEMCKRINRGLAIDVTELDAASNNGIDKIRDIIDDAKYPPQEAKFKVYIMDEVHMLSIGAVNAFLKTLEEPPENIIFILATTDPQKLPITILSRCQRFDFRRIGTKDIRQSLRKIVDYKGVLADDRSLELIARVSDGAMRDSLSILDQAIAMGDGKVEYDEVVSMLGMVTNESLFKITNAIFERNIEKAVSIIEEVVLSGKDMYQFLRELISHFRNLLMVKVTSNPEEVLDMSMENIDYVKKQGSGVRTEEIMRNIRILQEAEGNAKLSKESRLYLELAIIKMCKIEYDTSSEVILARINKLEEGIKSGAVKIEAKSQDEIKSIKEPIKQSMSVETKEAQNKNINVIHDNTNAKTTLTEVQRAWKDILEAFKSRRAMIVYASLLEGRPIDCKNGVVTVMFGQDYSLNKPRLEKKENYNIVIEVFSEIMGEDIKVKFVVESPDRQEVDLGQTLKNKLGDKFVKIVEE